jgi:hypothetical protein
VTGRRAGYAPHAGQKEDAIFPVSISGELETRALNVSDAQRVLREVQHALENERMGSVEQAGNTISFRVGIAAWLRWSFAFGRRSVSIISGGTIEVVPGDPGRIRYEASTRLFAVLSTAAVVLMVFTMLRDGWVGPALLFGPLGWLWVVGLNYVFGRAGVRDFVATMVDLEGQRPGSSACPSCGTPYDPADYRPEAPEKRCVTCRALLEPADGSSASAQPAHPADNAPRWR